MRGTGATRPGDCDVDHYPSIFSIRINGRSGIAAVRLTREPDVSGPSKRIVSLVNDSVRLARMILDRDVP